VTKPALPTRRAQPQSLLEHGRQVPHLIQLLPSGAAAAAAATAAQHAVDLGRQLLLGFRVAAEVVHGPGDEGGCWGVGVSGVVGCRLDEWEVVQAGDLVET